MIDDYGPEDVGLIKIKNKILKILEESDTELTFDTIKENLSINRKDGRCYYLLPFTKDS